MAERAAHNRSVVGSTPAGPTSLTSCAFADAIENSNIEAIRKETREEYAKLQATMLEV